MTRQELENYLRRRFPHRLEFGFRHILKDDVYQWLDETFGPRATISLRLAEDDCKFLTDGAWILYYGWCFKSENDMLLFKMRWSEHMVAGK